MRDALLSTVSYGALELGWRAGVRDRVDAANARYARDSEYDERAINRMHLRMMRREDAINITHRAYVAKGVYRFAGILFLAVLNGALKQRGLQ